MDSLETNRFLFYQFWLWAKAFLPNHQYFHMEVEEHSFVFDKKKRVNSPTKLVCSAFAFIFYWTGLDKVDNREQLETGVVVLKDAALHFLHEGASPGDAGVVLL